VVAEYNNERVVKEADIVLVCVLPSQAPEMFKDIRGVAAERVDEARINKHANKPVFVSTIAVTGYKKLRLMLSEDTSFIRTSINVGLIREYLLQTDNGAPTKAVHPLKSDDGKQSKQSRPASTAKKPAKISKVLSHKALKLGEETGVTAEFIVQQTAEQLVGKLEDLFLLFDVFQDALYSNDPQARPKSGKSSASRIKDEENRVMYEESILMTLLGPDYAKYINQETGEWTNEQEVLDRFYQMFETRIRYIFDAEQELP